ncbi:MAG: hypothetical protein K0V04_20300 [Deltaproteobacteria bacterium]|nr:hypothetical protein [Deltaproteobacteria bacterium]
MNSRPSLDIVGMGLACPQGLYLTAATAAMDAGVTPFEVTDDGRQLTVCRLQALDPASSRQDRMIHLLEHALYDALHGSTAVGQAGVRQIPVFMALPDDADRSPFHTAALLAAVRDQVHEHTGAHAIIDPPAITHHGRAGVFNALIAAGRRVAVGDAPLALVIGVDSLVDRSTLDALDERGVALGVRSREGRVSSEAAACLLVARPSHFQASTLLAQVLATATSTEPVSFEQIQAGASPNRAQGLTALFAELHRRFPGRTDGVFSAQTGERSWARGFARAYLRNTELMPEPLLLRSTNAAMGDVGAAAGVTAMIEAIGSFGRHAWSSEPVRVSALVFGESDRGALGGCILGTTCRS